MSGMTIIKGHWQLIAITALVFALWTTPVIFPLKLLVVFLHEVSHGLTAYLTGGSIDSLSVSSQEGGLAVTRGGNRFLTLSAGYVGSLLIGVILLLIALKTNADRAVMGFIGVATLAITALYIREGFPLAFGLGTGGVMLAVAYYLNRPVNDLILRVIGLTSMIYVPYDIFSDTLARSHLQSDARMLAEEFGGATVIWGGLWLLLSMSVIGLCLRYGLGRKSNIRFGVV